MTVDEAADRLLQFLGDVAFNSARPSPALAWEAFKRFAAEPVDTETTELWFEAADGDLTSESPAYFDFVRMFMHYPDNEAEWGEQVTAHFTAGPGVQLGLRGTIHVEDVADLPEFFRAVEASPSFRAAVRFEGWSFEVRIDGC